MASAGWVASGAEPEGAELTSPVTALRGALALGRHGVGGRLGAHLGTALAIAVALVYGFAASTGLELAAESNRGLVAGSLRWAAWVGAGPVALAAARGDGDRGLPALAKLAGIDPTQQALGRALAAALAMTLRIAAPALVVCLAGAIRFPSVGWGALALGASAAAIVIGAVIALVAVGCARIAPERGRSLFVAVVLLPHVVSRGAAEGWSLPGILGAVIDALTGRYFT